MMRAIIRWINPPPWQVYAFIGIPSIGLYAILELAGYGWAASGVAIIVALVLMVISFRLWPVSDYEHAKTDGDA